MSTLMLSGLELNINNWVDVVIHENDGTKTLLGRVNKPIRKTRANEIVSITLHAGDVTRQARSVLDRIFRKGESAEFIWEQDKIVGNISTLPMDFVPAGLTDEYMRISREPTAFGIRVEQLASE